MKKIKIGITTEQFIQWGGGVDFIRLLLNGLKSVQEKGDFDIDLYLFLPLQSNFEIFIKNQIKKILNFFLLKNYELNNVEIDFKLITDSFKSTNSKIKILKYNGTKESFDKKVLKNDIDFLLPLFSPLTIDYPVEWAGYIYDFQHKYYPEFFTDDEIKVRDENFLTMVTTGKKVIVNAEAVKKDIEKFIPQKKAVIFNLPFCPAINFHYFADVDLSKYNLPSRFFLISNQFWRHKDHSTAFKAIKRLIEVTGDKEVAVICTGQTIDYRFPNYFSELQDLISRLELNNVVHILGYIPKKHQLQLLKNCIAVIQPTLFEGGPGGGAVYESVAYGIPSIVSNIAVNKEIEDDSVTFFEAGSVSDLADKMQMILHRKREVLSMEELITKNQKRVDEMGARLIEIVLS